jgi:hypothetical protein
MDWEGDRATSTPPQLHEAAAAAAARTLHNDALARDTGREAVLLAEVLVGKEAARGVVQPQSGRLCAALNATHGDGLARHAGDRLHLQRPKMAVAAEVAETSGLIHGMGATASSLLRRSHRCHKTLPANVNRRQTQSPPHLVVAEERRVRVDNPGLPMGARGENQAKIPR